MATSTPTAELRSILWSVTKTQMLTRFADPDHAEIIKYVKSRGLDPRGIELVESFWAAYRIRPLLINQMVTDLADSECCGGCAMLADMLETWIFLHNNHLKDAHISIPQISEDIYEMFNEPMEEDSENHMQEFWEEYTTFVDAMIEEVGV
ncbi:Protein of unknown function [Pyronema omphalodes CBS 100304]|uniref:Uncharacterized protein n=1 Tax=Pyronema omphalodes (strain CBS 100304) TaxID=1076935 RepID=U4L443_PYROM|nr:Protein of unknown function [Pyronema omphalodes CBS 100304]